MRLEKMTYLPHEGKVLYGDSTDTKVYDTLDFLALLSCHITDRWERRVIACGEKMDIVSFIEDQVVIRKILTHLDLWTIPERPPPKSLLQDLDDYDIAS